jgi:hypothetical protein
VTDGVFARDGGLGVGQLLNSHINKLALQCWNVRSSADVVHSTLFAPNRDDATAPFVASDADPEILLHIPFHEVLRIRGILILGTNDSFAASSVKLFVNAMDISGFDSVERLTPEESLILANSSMEDAVVYRINPAKFQSVASVTMLFPDSFGEEETHLCRIEFYGESTSQPVNRPVATNVVYESLGNPADHKVLEDGRGAVNFVV